MSTFYNFEHIAPYSTDIATLPFHSDVPGDMTFAACIFIWMFLSSVKVTPVHVQQAPVQQASAHYIPTEDAVASLLSARGQSAKEILANLGNTCPLATKSDVNSCLFKLLNKRLAKKTSPAQGAPKWTKA
jgi:hypothetical protein